MANSRWMSLLVGLAALWLASVEPARAQMGYTQPCLELLIAESDLIVRGRVVAVDRRPGDERKIHSWETVTVEVHETLKGPASDRVAFGCSQHPSSEPFEGFRASGQEALFCLMRTRWDATSRRPNSEIEAERGQNPTAWEPVSTDQFGFMESVIRLGPARSGDQARLVSGRTPPPIFSLDLRLLREPNEILEATRALIAAEPRDGRPVRVHRVLSVDDFLRATGRAADANVWVVPLDPRLEAAARRWVVESEAIVRRLDDARTILAGKPKRPPAEPRRSAQLRRAGVLALAHFRSDENAAILRRLLDDPFVEPRQLPNGAVAQVFPVREAAAGVLSEWGVPVAKPSP